MSGLEATGWVAKSADEFAADMVAALRASPAFGPDVDTSGESVIGQLLAVFASQLASTHEAAGLVYASRDPRGATLAGLDVVASLTGTTRRAATKGTVTLSVTLAAGVTLPSGSIAHVTGDPTNRWVTLAAATNSSGSTAVITVNAVAETAGVYAANAATIIAIATPYTGWTAVTNAADAAPGSAAESDVQLRARRERELRALASSSLNGIRAALAAVTGVSSVSLEENATPAFDAVRVLPPNTLRATVQGGTDADVAAALFASRPAGIATAGSVSVVVTDAGGFSRTTRFSRPTTVNAYALVRVVVDAATYPGDTALAAAIANVTTGQLAGQPIRISSLITAALAVTGVVDCLEARAGRSGTAQYPSNLTAAPQEVLKLATARVTVVRVAA
jgi:uncharacterized phage protein gp47/JayE